MADCLIKKLNLVPHPDCFSWYCETYRSAGSVSRYGGQRSSAEEPENQRSAVTVIYALMKHGQQSPWHRLKSDEAFFFHKGCALKIHQLRPNADGGDYQSAVVGDGDHALLQYVVPAGTWFMQHPVTTKEDDFNLCSVAVSPGFDLRDHDVITDIETLCHSFPKLAHQIRTVSSRT